MPILPVVTAARLNLLKDDVTVALVGNGTAVHTPLRDLLKFVSPERVLAKDVVSFSATAGSQARSTGLGAFTVPANEFKVNDIVFYRFQGVLTATSSTSNCTITGEMNNAGSPTTPIGVTSATIAATTGGLAFTFEGAIKWTSATVWLTSANGVTATPGTKVIANAHLIDLALAVQGATNVAIAGMFEATLYRP